MQQLIELAIYENGCLDVIKHNKGSIEVLDAQLEVRGVYARYQAIHVAYARLLGVDSSQEALKRALFIQWASMTTFPCFSGIKQLDEAAELVVLTQLEHLLLTGAADAELSCMMQYYAQWDYVFDQTRFQHLTALQAFIQQCQTTGSNVSAPPLRIHEMPERGGMGAYWLDWGGGELLRKQAGNPDDRSSAA